jgi:hypothetical protein
MTTGTTQIDVRPLTPTVTAIDIAGDVTSASEGRSWRRTRQRRRHKTMVLDFQASIT